MALSSDTQFIPYRAVVGQVIIAHRRLMQMEQKELAARMGVNPANLSRLETGQAIPTVEQLAVIARVLGTTAGTLLTQADEWAARLEASGYVVARSAAEEPKGLSPLTAALLGGLLVTLFSRGNH